MIRNIVFDMGKVLLNYDAYRCCRHFLDDPADQKVMADCLFSSGEWILLDVGVLSEEQAMRNIKSRLPERLHDAADLCMKHWHEYCMWPIDGMKELVAELKQQGYGIYLCSNASLRMLTNQQRIPGIEYFDGVLFSAEVRCIKPQKEMYEHLFSRFHLDPRECFFIDDLDINIEGARACGMDGYCFADGNVAALKKALADLE